MIDIDFVRIGWTSLYTTILFVFGGTLRELVEMYGFKMKDVNPGISLLLLMLSISGYLIIWGGLL